MSRLRTALLVSLATGLFLAPVARSAGVDQTCLLVLTKFDPATVNVAYPDDSAQYYSGVYAVVPGTRIRITGRFPHARYMSFNVYDPALRPIDGLSDVRIEPDPGSSNPFVAGADRTRDDSRSYTVFVDPGKKPANPVPNTLYTGEGQNGGPNLAGTFVYRVYVPDRFTDDVGGVGLPTATIEPSSPAAAPAASRCSTITKPAVTGVNELLGTTSPPSDAPVSGGTNPPTWRKFVNLLSSVAINIVGEPNPNGVDLDTLGGRGGFLSNLDNEYVSTPINRTFGKVLVTRLRAPTFADTRNGTPTMPGGQLRYWSLCENDPPTQRMVACLNDDRSVVGPDGFATYVVSTPDQRPANATRQCGVNWLPWGPNPRGILIYRHMLPAPSFAPAIQNAEPDHEVDTMADYFPVSRYYADKAAYEQSVGCPSP